MTARPLPPGHVRAPASDATTARDQWGQPMCPLCGQDRTAHGKPGDLCPSAPTVLQVDDELRAALLVHHPIMRSETGPFSGCRCGQVRLGEDVVAHVVSELRRALDQP